MRYQNKREVMAEERVKAGATALYAGSFAPFTVGHLSVLERALPLFDRVIVVVGVNASKCADAGVEQRVKAIAEATSGLAGVEVMSWSGLMADLAAKVGATYMIRGVRGCADFENEYALATVNRTIAGVETVLIPALPEHVAVSSSVVRELKSYGCDVSQFLP